VGSLLELDGLIWPCPLTGGRDWSGIAALAISRSPSLDTPGLRLELQPLPDGPRGLWAPSATVVSAAVGWTDITVEHDDFTLDAAGDAGRFEDGAKLALYSSTGVPLCDVAAELDTKAGDVLTLVAAFSLAGAPVQPLVGNIITYPRWENGAAPEDTWDANMIDSVAQADGTATPPELPDGTEPYDYGS